MVAGVILRANSFVLLAIVREIGNGDFICVL